MTPPPLSRQSQICLLVLLTAIFLVNFIARLSLAPLMPVIERDLGLGHAGAGSFFMMIAIGYAVGLLGSGFLSARITFRRAIAFSAVSLGFSFCLIPVIHTLWMIRLTLALSGMAAGLYLPSAITTITASVSPANWGKAIAVHELAPSLACICAPFIVEGLLLFFPWQGALGVIGLVSLLLGISFLRLGTSGDFRGAEPSLTNLRLLIGNPAFWIMAALFGLAIGSSNGIYSMLPLYLVSDRGIDRSLANTLVGLSRIPLLAITPLAGWASDRFGAKPTMWAAICFSGVMTIILGVVPGQWVLLTIFLQPLLTVFFFPAGFMVLSRIVPPVARNLSVSLAILISYLIGAGLIPTVLGLFGDAGRFSLAFVLVGILMLLSVFLIGWLRIERAGC